MADLIAPHGASAELVDRTVPQAEVESFKAAAAKLPKLPVSDADLSTVYRFADGALSPLTGPMSSAVYNRVLDESVIEHEGKLFAWTIPLALPVTADLAASLKPGQTVALVNTAGAVVGTLDINDVYAWDKPRYIKSVYLTDRTDHPGADMVLKGDADKTHLVGGTVRVLPQPKHAAASANMCSRRARSANCWRARAGIGSWRFRPATRCIGPMNTLWFMASKRCFAKATTPARP